MPLVMNEDYAVRDAIDSEIWLAHHEAYSAWIGGVADAARGRFRTQAKRATGSQAGVQAADQGVQAAASQPARQP